MLVVSSGTATCSPRILGSLALAAYVALFCYCEQVRMYPFDALAAVLGVACIISR